MEDEVEDEVVEPVMKNAKSVQILLKAVRSCVMPEEDEGLVDDVDSADVEDVTVEVTDVVVVTVGVAEEEVLEEEEEDEEEEVVVVKEEVEEVEDSVPSFDAPFSTVKVSLTAS